MPPRRGGLINRLLKGSGDEAKPRHLAALVAACGSMGRYLLFLPYRTRSFVVRRGHAVVVRGRGTLSWDPSVQRWQYPRGLSIDTDLPWVLVKPRARVPRRARLQLQRMEGVPAGWLPVSPRVGSVVRLVGLASATDSLLNGCTGVVDDLGCEGRLGLARLRGGL